MTKPLNILIVEDSPADAKLLVAELRTAGFEPTWKRIQTEPDFLAGIQKLPDIILSDYSMPEFDGLRAAELLKASGLDIPFILISGTVGEDVAVDAMKHGATDYLLKDRLGRLGSAVERALREAQMRTERKQAEAALRASEAELRALAESIPQMVWAARPDGWASYCNQQWMDYTGLTLEESLGHGWAKPFHPDDRQRAWDAWQQATREGGLYSIECRLRRADGVYRWWLMRGVPQRDATDRILKWFGTCTDIQDMKEVQDVAKHEQQLTSAVIESIPGAFFMLDKNGRFVRWNAYERDEIIGKPEALITGTDALETIHPDDRELISAKMVNVLEHGAHETVETRVLLKGGPACRWFLMTGRQMVVDGSPFLLGIGIDVTERKQKDEELQKLRTAVEQSANAIVITDRMGTIEYVNPAFEQITGYSRAEAVGQNPSFLKSGGKDVEFYRNLWKMIASGKIWCGEFHNKRKDGSLYWESATISPVQNDKGEILHFIAIKEDITGRKLMESRLADALLRAEAGAAAKSQFLSIMSHELLTPLNGVLGFAELLSITPLNDEQMGFARTISQSGNHLLQVVNDILDFSSIEKGHVPLESSGIAIADLVESSVVPSRITAAEKGLKLLCEMDPGLPVQLTGDERRIRQILINLIGNAVKFTAAGSVIVRVAPSSVAGRPALDISVEDTGPGIHAETIALLFNPFVQEDMTLHRPFEGTGLGLAISQRLAEAMGGLITVRSVFGQGSTFTLRLPLEAPLGTGSPPASGKPLPTAVGSAQTGGTPAPREDRPVLVVEDDASNSDLAEKMLNVLGFRAEFAFDGAQALQAYAPGKYAAILMDMQMPVMDGLAATRKIREIEAPVGSHVPIIALTANVMPGDRERCLAAGMDDFLSKPFNKAGLASKMECVDPTVK